MKFTRYHYHSGGLQVSLEIKYFTQPGNRNQTFIIYSVEEEIEKLIGSDHRVLFQNAEGNINMGVLFNDPNVDLDDICWYNLLSIHIIDAMGKNEELITFDKESNTPSCYVELHRKGYRFH